MPARDRAVRREYGALWYRSNTAIRKRRHFGMPEESLPKPTEQPVPASGQQQTGPPADGGRSAEQNHSMTPPNSPATPIPAASLPVASQTPQSQAPQRIPRWLQHAERFLRVIVRIYLGLLVCLAPWYPPAWDSNPLFMSSPGLLAFITHGAVRGLISGLGLLNLWIALRDAMRPSAGHDS